MGRLGVVTVGVALLLLLAATVAATLAGLGTWANLAIAAAKAGLVLWFFMELRAAPPLLRLICLGTVGWLAILFGLGFADWLAR
ncbi:MAG: cytochrome C oxidase subunit IV family protein [Actinomycetota bacterium]